MGLESLHIAFGFSTILCQQSTISRSWFALIQILHPIQSVEYIK